MELQGRTVIVTGASGGIGAALTAELVRARARVLAVARRAAPLHALAAEHAPGYVVPLAADLSTAEGRAALHAAAMAVQPTPSVLVIAHASSGFGLFEQQSEAALANLLHADVVAPTLLVRGLLPLLGAHADAAVVAVGSTFGSLGFPGFAAYSAAKFGLRGLFEALAREHADGPVRFQYLAPRATRTPFNSDDVVALNLALGTASDAPEDVARWLLASIRAGAPRRQLGWPEKLFARLNGLLPELVDRSLRKQLPLIRTHAQRAAAPRSMETPA